MSNFYQRSGTGKPYQNPSTINNRDMDITATNLSVAVRNDPTYGTYRKYADGTTQGRSIRLARLRSNALALTSGTTADLMSVGLPVGSWNISGAFGGTFAGGTNYRTIRGGFSRTSATLPGNDTWAAPNTSGEVRVGFDQTVNFNAGDFAVVIPKYRVDVTTSFTLYLVIDIIFTVSTAGGFGFLEIESVV